MQQVDINTHRIYGRMLRLSQQIAKDQGYNLDVVFGNAQGSFCHTLGKSSYLVKYGRKMIARDARIGYREHPFSYAWLWPNQVRMTGLKAAWALVIHELAHTIQYTITTGPLWSRLCRQAIRFRSLQQGY